MFFFPVVFHPPWQQPAYTKEFSLTYQLSHYHENCLLYDDIFDTDDDVCCGDADESIEIN